MRECPDCQLSRELDGKRLELAACRSHVFILDAEVEQLEQENRRLRDRIEAMRSVRRVR